MYKKFLAKICFKQICYIKCQNSTVLSEKYLKSCCVVSAFFKILIVEATHHPLSSTLLYVPDDKTDLNFPYQNSADKPFILYRMPGKLC